MIMCPFTIGVCRSEKCALFSEEKGKCVFWLIQESLEKKGSKITKDMADEK